MREEGGRREGGGRVEGGEKEKGGRREEGTEGGRRGKDGGREEREEGGRGQGVEKACKLQYLSKFWKFLIFTTLEIETSILRAHG